MPAQVLAHETSRAHQCRGVAAVLAAARHRLRHRRGVLLGSRFRGARHSILNGLAPADIALHRFVWAGLALLPGALANGLAEVSAIGWGRALTLTVVAGPLQALVSYLGFTMVPLGHGVVIQPAASALAALILAALALREPTTARFICSPVR